MLKGVSPVVSFVLIISITVITSLSIYYWIAGSTHAPAIATTQISIQAHKYNSTVIKITNLDVMNTSVFSELETSKGTCSLNPPTAFEPGVTYSCLFSSPVSGYVQVWADGIKTAIVQM